MRQEFKQIIADLKKIKQEEQLNKLDDNMLFDGAIRIYNSMLINQKLQRTLKERQQDLLPMTEKQLRLLEKLNYVGKTELTKAEANKAIQQLLDKQKKGAPQTLQRNTRF